MKDGLYAVGEFLGVDSREKDGKYYYTLKLLVNDFVMKLDLRDGADQEVQKNYVRNDKLLVGYYEFVRPNFTSRIVNSVSGL
ncbi:hypothetical protein MF069_36585 [Paenibacillus mucilaginosus]|uniref:hypothetical protein n=1 Tax=Paenibacillus mucilaginosus TaxID=61624 RepID=UPI001EF02CAF|nr:hypothetical protein [Paenibacillus mucilaginosus]MCG7218219.1 hypothetical protein [Paenibacillus mucilaginosus]